MKRAHILTVVLLALAARGTDPVPRDDIVLAFHPPERRPLTEFAVA